jgi:hypothetical protein
LYEYRYGPLVRAMGDVILSGPGPGERIQGVYGQEYASGAPTGNPLYLKLLVASSQLSNTSNTSESLVTTKMFWIFLSTAQSFISAPRFA